MSRRVGICIGCSTYEDPIPSLAYAGHDANTFAGLLDDVCGVRKEDLLLFSDRDEGRAPRFTSVLRALTGPSQQYSDDIDLLFFFFSGHGFRSSTSGQDYLVLSDSVPEDLESTSISIPAVLSRLESWNPRHLVLFIDACRDALASDKGPQGGLLTPPDVNALLPRGHIAFASCSPGERSFESPLFGQGIFTHALKEAWNEDNQCATVYELNTFLTQRTPELSQVAGKARQRPSARLEPAEVLHLELVKPEKRHAWFGSPRVGSEIRPLGQRSARGAAHTQAVAIDFGTCNSLIAELLTSGESEVIPGPDGRAIIPSVVAFRSGTDYVVGAAALDALQYEPQDVITYPKRMLGSGHKYHMRGASLSPEFVASLILRHLKANYEDYKGVPLGPVLCGHPAAYSPKQVAALRRAFAYAGIKIKRLISEPSAAALLAEGPLDTTEPSATAAALVVDLGGGTLDVSVVSVGVPNDDGGSIYEVEASSGTSELGGVDYDDVLVQLITRSVEEEIGVGPLSDPRFAAQVRQEAQRAKHLLSRIDGCHVFLPALEVSPGVARDFDLFVTRDEFMAHSEPLDEIFVKTVKDCLDRAPDEPLSRLGSVVLAGQGSRVPSVLAKLKDITTAPLVQRYSTDAVVRGLARQSGVLSAGDRRLLLVDIAHRDLCLLGARVHDRGWRTVASRRGWEIRENREVTITGFGLDVLVSRGVTIPTARDFRILLSAESPVERLTFATLGPAGGPDQLATVEVPPLVDGHSTLELTATLGAASDETLLVLRDPSRALVCRCDLSHESQASDSGCRWSTSTWALLSEGVKLSSTIEQGLQEAAREAAGYPIQSGSLLSSISRADGLGRWDRVWLEAAGDPVQLELAQIPDSGLEGPVGEFLLHECVVSPQLAWAMQRLESMVGHYRIETLHPGHFALAIIAETRCGASRRIAATGSGLAAVSQVIQEDVLGVSLKNFADNFLDDSRREARKPQKGIGPRVLRRR